MRQVNDISPFDYTPLVPGVVSLLFFFQTCKINEYINASPVEITPVLNKGDRREQKYPSSSLGLCQDSLILELLDKGQHVKENMQWGF